MAAIRIAVIATAAVLALAPTGAPAQVCDDRYPTTCPQAAAETTPATEAATAAETPSKKRKPRASEQADTSRPAARAGAAASREPLARSRDRGPIASPAPRGQPAARVSERTTVVDAPVMLPQSLAYATEPPATAERNDGTAFAAVGTLMTLPTGEPRISAGGPTDDADAGDPTVSVRFVAADQVNEIDLAAAGPAPDEQSWSWLRYVLATLGAAGAAATAALVLYLRRRREPYPSFEHMPSTVGG